MSFQLRLSNRAVQDIEEILRFTLTHFGEYKYTAYAQLIADALSEIAADPNGPRSKRRPEIHPDVLTIHLSRRGNRARHFILYRVVNDKYIEVARLLHDSMEVRRHLPEHFK
jgi:toxin ParE1/3/4